MTDSTTTDAAAREDLVAMMEKHRGFLLQTTTGLTDDQARLTPTVSALSIGGLVKHVTDTVASWLDFVEHGASEEEVDWNDPSAYEAFANGHKLLPDETLAGVLAQHEAVSARAAALARSVDLDETHHVPEAPWFADESWSNRRVFMHILAETAQHAGHADIIRETIDGQKTMG